MSSAYIYLVPILVAFFLAFNMGGSGTSPSFSAVYGANLIRKEYIAGLFGVFVLFGALLAGGKVLNTIGGAIIPSEEMNLVTVSILMLASAFSILFANLLNVPQSTSQSTIFALAGCGLYLSRLQTGKLFLEIIPLWFILPVLSFIFTYILGRLLLNLKASSRLPDFYSARQRPFWVLLTLALSCYVAFSIGSNNVANAAGPIAVMMLNELSIGGGSDDIIISLIAVLLVAPWFGIGSSVLGGRVLQTTGKEIINIGPMGAALIALVTATLLLLSSTLRGIPASLVQMNTFAIIALGVVKGSRSDFSSRKTIIRLTATWLSAPVLAFCLALVLMALADWLDLI